MRILILEDEAVIAERIKRICSQFLAQRAPSIQVVDELDEARELLADNPVDLLMLDLNLYGKNGLSLLEASTSRAHYTIIVSAHADQAVQAFEYGVLDFVAKPFTQERLVKALARMDDARWRSDRALERLAVRGAGGFRLIPISAIAYVQAAGHYCEFVMDDGKVWLHDKNIELLGGLLPANFERVHRSYIVPLQKIDALLSEPGGRYGIRLDNGAHVPVGRSRYAALRERWAVR